MAEALLWLESEAPEAQDVPAFAFCDSAYAFSCITGDGEVEANSELVMKCREILRRVSVARALTFEHVRAHTGIVGNERADALA